MYPALCCLSRNKTSSVSSLIICHISERTAVVYKNRRKGCEVIVSPRRRRTKGVWFVFRLRTGKLAPFGRACLAIGAIGLYAYILITQPFSLDLIPPISPVGTPLPQMASIWLEREVWPVSMSLNMASIEECGVVPVTSAVRIPTERYYGTVEEEELPWSNQPPPALVGLKEQIEATRLVSAFRTTLPDPLWGEAHNVALGANYMAGTIVMPGESFSLIGAIGPFIAEKGYENGPTYIGGRIVPTLAGGVCKIGTTVYNAVVHADLRVLERKPHSMQVSYARSGRDAAIATGHKNVRFQNDKDTPVLIWSDVDDRTLYVAIYGSYEAPEVSWSHEELSRQKTWVIRRPADDLLPGEERIVIAGLDGVTVRTSISVEYPGEDPIIKASYVDTYLPLPETIEYGE